MFKLSSIKLGMQYHIVRNEINKSDNLTISSLPAFCMSDYREVRNLDTDETVYILWDLKTGVITDVTKEFSKAVDCKKANKMIEEILNNNGI